MALFLLSTNLAILAKNHGPRFFREKMTGTLPPVLFCFFWEGGKSVRIECDPEEEELGKRQ